MMQFQRLSGIPFGRGILLPSSRPTNPTELLVRMMGTRASRHFPRQPRLLSSPSISPQRRLAANRRCSFQTSRNHAVSSARPWRRRRRFRVRHQTVSLKNVVVNAMSTFVNPNEKNNLATIPEPLATTAASFPTAQWLHELRTSPANWMTLSRMIVAPGLGYCIIHGHNTAAVIGCSLAAVSDALDGYVARRFKCETQLGTYLDPLGMCYRRSALLFCPTVNSHFKLRCI